MEAWIDTRDGSILNNPNAIWYEPVAPNANNSNIRIPKKKLRNTIFFTSTQFINDRPYWMAAIILSVSHRIATVRTEMFHKMVSQMLWCQIINYKTHWFTNYKVGCVFPMLVVLLTLLMTSRIDLWPLEMLRVGHVCKRNFKQVINRFFIPGKGKWTWNMENRTWNWTWTRWTIQQARNFKHWEGVAGSKM